MPVPNAEPILVVLTVAIVGVALFMDWLAAARQANNAPIYVALVFGLAGAAYGVVYFTEALWPLYYCRAN